MPAGEGEGEALGTERAACRKLTGVPLRRLKHSNGVVREVEEDDEPAVQVYGSGRVHARHKPQHVAVQPVPVTLHELLEVPGSTALGLGLGCMVRVRVQSAAPTCGGPWG